MLHGDECTHVRGHNSVERMQINMIFAAALHILCLLNWSLHVVVITGGGGVLLLYCMIVKTTVIQI